MKEFRSKQIKPGKIITRAMENFNSKFKLLRNRSAFTLIELLVVISIIGILITLVMVAIVPVQRKSRDARRKADVNSFLTAADLFKADFKLYPNTTFNLGEQGSATDGDVNSNFGVATDVFSCNSATVGATSTFATTANPTVAQLNNVTPGGSNKITLKPGFASINNFLICLKYTSTLLTDPKPTGSNADKYQYRASYDYGDIIVSSMLENSNDSDGRVLFNVTASDTSPSVIKRYYRGSGVVVRHLDDSSDTSTFWNFVGNAFTNNDGKYLYQCKINNLAAAIKPDDRITYEPILSGATFTANSNCQNSAGGLDVIDAF